MSEASEHCNIDIDGVDDLMVLKSSDVKGPHDFGNVARNELTELTKSCLRSWRSVYGCRFGCYDMKVRKQVRKCRKHICPNEAGCARGCSREDKMSRGAKPLSAFFVKMASR